MPVHLLSAAERDRANRFPLAIPYEDLVTFFTLSVEDQEQIPVHAGPHARLGFALELCALRFMGFVPDDLTSAPPEAVTFVARQLAVEPEVLAHYTGSPHTRMHHRKTIQAYLGYRRSQREDIGAPAANGQICAAAHIPAYVEFRNMWSLWPGRPVTLYKRANLPGIFLAAFSIVKGIQSINFSANLSPKTPFLREFAQFSSC